MNINMGKWLMMGLALLMLTNAHALDTWYDHGHKGWHFYDDPVKEKPKEKIEQPTPTPDSTMPVPEKETDHLKWAEAVKQKGEWLKARALRHRNPENTLAYIQYQNEVAGMANGFAEDWPHVLRHNPEQDFSSTHPVTQSGRYVYYDSKKANDKKTLKALAEHYGLLFFYASTCGYCHQQAPIVASVAKEFDMPLLGVSLDGQPIPGIEHFEPNSGMAEELNVQNTPALFLINLASNQIIPVKTGVISGSDLTELLSEIVAYENLS